MFKLIGVIAGYYFFGFFGALFGLFVGGFFDRMRAYGSGGMNPLQNALRQAVFLETVFISMGKLAKADGQVSEGEIAHVEQFMQKLGITAEQRSPTHYFFGFFGGLFGLFVGGFFDRMRAYGSGGMNPMQNALRQAVFIETVFISMGKLAKADGHVSQDDIAHVEQFMQKLGMTVEHRQQAIALFKRGADPAFDIEPTCRRFMSVCGQTKNLK